MLQQGVAGRVEREINKIEGDVVLIGFEIGLESERRPPAKWALKVRKGNDLHLSIGISPYRTTFIIDVLHRLVVKGLQVHLPRHRYMRSVNQRIQSAKKDETESEKGQRRSEMKT